MKRLAAGLALACLLLLCLAQAASAHGSGVVMAWGKNVDGQLGDGTTDNSSQPLQTGGLVEARAVAGGASHTVALKVGGTVWAWGDNTYGQLGDGTTDGSLSPVQVVDAAGTGLTGITAIACGANHTAALKTDGSVCEWGDNTYGQLGNGSSDQSAHPVPGQVTGAGGTGLRGVIAIACGQDFTVALSSGGTVIAWGKNDHGQLGNNTTVDSSVPVPVGGLSGIVAIAAGGAHAMALKSDGTVWAWGANDRGQLGDNTTAESSFPVQVSITGGAVAVACGEAHSVALMSDGTVRAWGDNTFGQLGDGTADASLAPVQVAGSAGTVLTGITAIACGANHTVALGSDGTVLAWGENGEGQLGDGTAVDRYAPVQVGGVKDVLAVACGYGHTIAIAPPSNPDIVEAWGNNTYNQLGDGTGADSGVPVKIIGMSGIKAVADGSSHALALRPDGTVWGWGYNYFGQLGDGRSAIKFSLPVQAISLAGIKDIAAGQHQTLALGSDGTVRAWGYNYYGQVGVGNTTNSSLPLPVGLSGAKAVAGGQTYSAALKSDGTVWTWGYNNCGQLGDGTSAQRKTPVQVRGLIGIKAIACGYAQTFGLKSDGSVWAWGYNGYGGLGDGSLFQRYSPVQVSGLQGVVAIASGFNHAAALRSDGTVWTWGSNSSGQLGDGTWAIQRNTPVQVKGLDGVIAIAAGAYHVVALKSDGTVWAWGDNTSGQVGSGTKNNSSNVPVQVAGLTDVTGVAAGVNFTSASMAVPDMAAPSSEITAPSDGAILSGTACDITGAASDGSGSGVQKVEVSINGGDWVKASGTAGWRYRWVSSSDGMYAIKCRVTDNAGNVETAGTGIKVIVDNTAPSSAITSYPANNSAARSIWNISGTASDGTGSGVRKVEVSTDGGATWHMAAGMSAWSYSCPPPAFGSYSIKSRATDNAGNIEPPVAGVSVSLGGLDLAFRQDGRTVILSAAGFNGGKPLSGRIMTFYMSQYNATNKTWEAWSVLGAAVSGADGTASMPFVMLKNGTYRFRVECPVGAAMLSGNPTDNCAIHPVNGLSPASGSVQASKTPAVSWAAFTDDTGNAIATGYRLQTAADPNFITDVTNTDLGNVTTTTLPAQAIGATIWWRTVAFLPYGSSVASAAVSITHIEKTSLSGLNVNTWGGSIIIPYVVLSGSDSGAISGKKVFFYYEENAGIDWKFAGQARTDSSGTARMAPLALSPGTYDLKVIFNGCPGFTPCGSEVVTLTLQ